MSGCGHSLDWVCFKQTGQPPAAVTTGVDPEDVTASIGSAEGTLVATMTQLLKAHTEAIAAQTASQHLPYLLFAYRSSVQESTRESPFYLLYGRDPRLATDTVLCAPARLYPTDIGDYRNELTTKLASAWANAKKEIGGAQAAQKRQYDRAAKDPKLRCGDRVMVYMPSEVQGKDRKLARPYHGPYRVLNITPTNAEVVLIDQPRDPPIFVSLSRVRHCYEEMADVSWSGPRRKRRRRRRTRSKAGASGSDAVVEPPPGRPEPSPQQESVPQRAGPITRSMTRTRSD